ncbi:MAG: glycoside hydrolase family 31 protein, partial [Steroidobacteraceae bacterium]|nr:glycoside hydrolase family 31 protein [Steroidobacteraceae bacterium]
MPAAVQANAHCVARAGRMVRLVVGADRLPDLSFAAPDAPGWSFDEPLEFAWSAPAFTLADDGEPLLIGSASVDPWRIDFAMAGAEILGFGAATGGANRNDARFRVMTRDTLFFGIPGASYTALPFFIARSAGVTLGVLVATPLPLDVVVEQGKVTITAACATAGAPLDVIVLRGSVVEIVRDLSSLVGRTFLPPAWALGFHQSRWSYKTDRAVLEVACKFRALDLPADVIHLDIHHMDRYRVFTWHPRRFPQPAAMHRELAALGLRTMAIVDPGVSVAPYAVHEALRAGRMLLERSNGQPYVGKVWPGATVFPDFTQPQAREAWGLMHRPLVEAGVAGFWNDMNDPVLRAGEVYDPLAEDVWHHGVPHARLRNLYANGMAEATVSGLRALRPGKRPFVLSRSGGLGIQRHAAVWTGDNHSSWQHLRENLHAVVNLGLSGVPISGADVGGFGRGPGKYGAIKPFRPSAELFIRWMELGALLPFFRVHCTLYAPRQEPWSFGRPALDLARELLKRRYRLLPLLYRLALEAHETGLPIVRPLFMHYDVPQGTAADQFLLGDRVLVAPVLEKGATRRDVWLPSGMWTQWLTGQVHVGGQAVIVDAPLAVTPIFIREG